MTKPHEEEWFQDEESPEWVSQKDGVGALTVARFGFIHSPTPIDFERARLASKAPKMARALLEIREALVDGTLDQSGAVEVCERVLREAGVLE